MLFTILAISIRLVIAIGTNYLASLQCFSSSFDLSNREIVKYQSLRSNNLPLIANNTSLHLSTLNICLFKKPSSHIYTLLLGLLNARGRTQLFPCVHTHPKCSSPGTATHRYIYIYTCTYFSGPRKVKLAIMW